CGCLDNPPGIGCHRHIVVRRGCELVHGCETRSPSVYIRGEEPPWHQQLGREVVRLPLDLLRITVAREHVAIGARRFGHVSVPGNVVVPQLVCDGELTSSIYLPRSESDQPPWPSTGGAHKARCE